jgi:lysozyme
MLKLSDEGLALIKHFEGFKSKLYNCPAGDCSIGYGHLVHLGPIDGRAEEKPFENGISEAQGSALLLRDTGIAQDAINHFVRVELTQHQFDSLVDWTFNEGSGRLQHSTLLLRVNARQFDQVAVELRKWVIGAGKVLPGLVERRLAETKLWDEQAA